MPRECNQCHSTADAPHDLLPSEARHVYQLARYFARNPYSDLGLQHLEERHTSDVHTLDPTRVAGTYGSAFGGHLADETGIGGTGKASGGADCLSLYICKRGSSLRKAQPE